MLETMKTLVKEKDICVLATVWDNKPHCSLMAYASDDTGLEIYMATKRETKKFRNVLANPNVSLLIDTRDEGVFPDRGNVKALTITGRYEAITDPDKKEAIRKNLMKHHSHLRDIIQDDDGEIIAIKITSFLLLNGPVDAHFEMVEENHGIP